jgi:hypothetical protein
VAPGWLLAEAPAPEEPMTGAVGPAGPPPGVEPDIVPDGPPGELDGRPPGGGARAETASTAPPPTTAPTVTSVAPSMRNLLLVSTTVRSPANTGDGLGDGSDPDGSSDDGTSSSAESGTRVSLEALRCTGRRCVYASDCGGDQTRPFVVARKSLWSTNAPSPGRGPVNPQMICCASCTQTATQQVPRHAHRQQTNPAPAARMLPLTQPPCSQVTASRCAGVGLVCCSCRRAALGGLVIAGPIAANADQWSSGAPG